MTKKRVKKHANKKTTRKKEEEPWAFLEKLNEEGEIKNEFMTQPIFSFIHDKVFFELQIKHSSYGWIPVVNQDNVRLRYPTVAETAQAREAVKNYLDNLR